MSDITPADLAKFVHPVPVGATIPAGMEHVAGRDGNFFLGTLAYDHEQTPGALDRWTAEPIPAPEPSLAKRARVAAMTARINSDVTLSNLALIVAELADRIEAER